MNTIADLKALAVSRRYDGESLYVSGYSAAGDGGGGIFRYSLTSEATDDGGKYIRPNSGDGRYIADFTNVVSASRYGAVGDGVTDDSEAIQAAIDYCYQIGGGTVVIEKKHRIGNTIDLSVGVSLTSAYSIRDARDADVFETKNGMLLLDPTASIWMREASNVSGLIIVPYGMNFPQNAAEVSAWTGTAIVVKANAHGATVENCCIVGFERAIDGESTAYTEQTRIKRCAIDCINGVRVYGGSDIVSIEDVECWPTASVGLSGLVPADLIRAGIAFELNGDIQRIDAPSLRGCFAYGYATGFKLFDVNGSRVIDCVADWPDIAGTRTGFSVSGDSISTFYTSCHAWRQTYGWDIDCAQNVHSVTILGCHAEFSVAVGIRLGTGTVYVSGGTIVRGAAGAQTPVGVQANDSPSGSVLVVSETMFDFCTVAAQEAGSTNGNTLHMTKCIHTANGANTVSASYAIVTGAASVGIPSHTYFARVQVGADIEAITSPSTPGRRLTLVFNGSQVVKHSTDIQLSGAVDFNATADDVLDLVWDGTKWYEAGRTVV